MITINPLSVDKTFGKVSFPGFLIENRPWIQNRGLEICATGSGVLDLWRRSGLLLGVNMRWDLLKGLLGIFVMYFEILA